MLFDEPTTARVGYLWRSVDEASNSKANLWHESWDRPLDGLSACYEAAAKTHTLEAWRSVVVQGRAVRAALENHDGHEHRVYIAVTRLTDAVDQAMDALAKDGRGLVTPEQVEQLRTKVQNLETAVQDDRAKRSIFESETRKTLGEALDKVQNAKRAIIKLENVTLKPNFSLISTGLAEVAELIKTAIQFIENRQLIEKIKQAAKVVKTGAAEFFREVRARFAAFRLPWRKTKAEDYLEADTDKKNDAKAPAPEYEDKGARLTRTFAGHGDWVYAAAFSPDGRTIVSGSLDKTLKLWDAATGREIRTLTGHGDAVLAAAFSPDGGTIVSASWDNTLKLWDAATGREIRTLTGHGSTVYAAAFSPDGRTIVSGGCEVWDSAKLRCTRGDVKLWDAATGREIRTLTGHESIVFAAAFSPDGRTIVSASNDGTLKLWDASEWTQAPR
jgi:hypothetical protein